MLRRNTKNCAIRSELARCICLDREGMNVGLHELAQGLVHLSVAAEGRLARKDPRDDRHPEVSAAVPSAGMAGVKVALILYFEEFGLQGVKQQLPDHVNSLLVHLKILIQDWSVG
jgi:hypothetical protein